jgi:hypothetical protein
MDEKRHEHGEDARAGGMEAFRRRYDVSYMTERESRVGASLSTV